MDAEGMWKTSTGKGVKVAVLDTGVNPDTSSLKGQVLEEEVPRSVSYNATKDYDSHGTTMAEVIAGTGAGGGLQGLAPDAKIVPYRVLAKSEMNATDRKKTPTVEDAIKAAADSDAQIISMSFTGITFDSDDVEAIKYAQTKGKLMFAGTGNDAESKNLIGYPARYPYVVGVAAADETGKVAKYSEHGHGVDLAAPGLNLPQWCDATFRSYCDGGGGTSAATAIASASAALIWSAHPDWTANQVLRSLIDTAGRTWPEGERSNYLGYGLARPRKVLENSSIDPGPANKDPLSFENGISLKVMSPSESPSPSPSTSAPSKAPKNPSGGGTSAATTNSDTSDNTVLWVALGAAGALAVIGGGAFAVVRSRRGT
ncbi:S8 family serine peptidase [Streptomyces sp. NBC_00286]|nr:S8 family serine peptidase [Streptomyces sp. NBC_00286]